MKEKLKPVLIVVLTLIEIAMRFSVLVSGAMGAMTIHGPRLRRVRNSVNKDYPAGENPGIMPFTTKPGKFTHPVYNIKYVPWSKYYKQLQVIQRYGLAGLVRMDEPEIAKWLERCLQVFTDPRHCDTKGINKRKKDPSTWTIKLIGLVYESEPGEENYLMDLGKDVVKGKMTWHQIETIDCSGLPPSIWRINPITKKQCFPFKNYITDDGISFEPPSDARAHRVAMVASTGPVYVPGDVFG